MHGSPLEADEGRTRPGSVLLESGDVRSTLLRLSQGPPPDRPEENAGPVSPSHRDQVRQQPTAIARPDSAADVSESVVVGEN